MAWEQKLRISDESRALPVRNASMPVPAAHFVNGSALRQLVSDNELPESIGVAQRLRAADSCTAGGPGSDRAVVVTG